MPGDRFFPPSDRVATYEYQLGLDRLGSEDPRSPGVLWGDPSLCASVEAFCRFRDSSTNFAISFSEWVDDVELATIGRSFVEDLLLIGVPRDFYCYSLVRHDEAPVPETERDKALPRRSGLHGKIPKIRLPNGRFLQPMYSPKDRMLTTLFFADLAIRTNRSCFLDPGRQRDKSDQDTDSDTLLAKALIIAAVECAPRHPDGSLDPLAALMSLGSLGNLNLDVAKGVAGRRGLAIRFTGQSKSIRLFDGDFRDLGNFLETHKNTKQHETNRMAQEPHREEFFPDGSLIRTPEFAKRIATALAQWRLKRADYNRRRYGLDRPTITFGGLFVPCRPTGDPRGVALVGTTNGAPRNGSRSAENTAGDCALPAPGCDEPGPEHDQPNPDRLQPKLGRNHSSVAQPGLPASTSAVMRGPGAMASTPMRGPGPYMPETGAENSSDDQPITARENPPSTNTSHGTDTEKQSTETGLDPIPPGAHPRHRSPGNAVASIAAENVRRIHRALERARNALERARNALERGARALGEKNRVLDLLAAEISQAGGLDCSSAPLDREALLRGGSLRVVQREARVEPPKLITATWEELENAFKKGVRTDDGIHF